MMARVVNELVSMRSEQTSALSELTARVADLARAMETKFGSPLKAENE